MTKTDKLILRLAIITLPITWVFDITVIHDIAAFINLL